MKLSEYQVNALTECGVPEHMHGAIIRYYDNCIPPGDFLQAVINNDLKGAFGRADDINRQRIYNFLQWFYNYAPGGSWGYHGAVEAWIKAEQKECA